MDCSEARLDRIESQRSMEGSQEQCRQSYIPLSLIKKGLRTLSSRGFLQTGGEDTTPPTEDTESVPGFLTNLQVSDLFDLPGEFVLINPEIFSAVSAGKRSCLEKLRSYGTQMACFMSEKGDSVLHLAAFWGHLELVKSIVSECPSLLLMHNAKDQLPLHVAARGGHSEVVEALVTTITFVSAKLSEEEKERRNPYVVKDIDGDTPLHLAIKDIHMGIAASLVKANQQASFLANKDRISPLYLAVEAGNTMLVNAMLNGLERGKTNLDLQLEGRKYLAHAALKPKCTATLKFILQEYPSLVDERDEEGRNCLSFGAAMGYYKGVIYILERSPKSVYECDDDGSFPIHLAIENGDKELVGKILTRCPDSKHLLNKKGQNILHIVANSGKFSLLLYLTFFYETKHLANEQDKDGNTPLHLATIKWRPRVVHRLCRNENLLVQNNNGLTALDIAELNLQSHYIFRERLTVMVLVSRYVLRDIRLMHTMRLTRPSEPLNREGNTEYVNALLVVATLVATVTFAAGFTIPGGFNSSAPNLGMATMATDPRLFIFLLLDTLAMQSSILAIIALIWAQLGDPALFRTSTNFALPLLCFALVSMAFAFFFGVIMTIRKVKVLVVIISIITVLFFYMMLFIIGPHVSLQRSGLRFLWALIFMRFVIFVNDDKEESYQISTHRSVKRAESLEISGNDHVEMPYTC